MRNKFFQYSTKVSALEQLITHNLECTETTKDNEDLAEPKSDDSIQHLQAQETEEVHDEIAADFCSESVSNG